MFSCWRLVLLLSLIALFISHSESTFLNDEEEQLRSVDADEDLFMLYLCPHS